MVFTLLFRERSASGTLKYAYFKILTLFNTLLKYSMWCRGCSAYVQVGCGRHIVSRMPNIDIIVKKGHVCLSRSAEARDENRLFDRVK